MALGGIPQAVSEWLAAQGAGAPAASQPVGGGCINHGVRLQTTGGSTFFLKTNARAPADMFAREAEGLAALNVPGGPRVPMPLLHGTDFLLLEDLKPGSPGPDYWPRFGQELAALHSRTAEQYGFAHDNYIGSTSQCNTWTADGYMFYAEHRLVFQGQLAGRSGLLTASEVRQVERLAERLRQWVPPQPPALLHGDLWSGNALSDAHGAPAIIDPAAYYGWVEAELAMTTLFGAFPQSFYRAYEAVHPLEPGWRGRLDLYNLYHLLNHLNLFGGSYYGSVMGVLRRYAAG